MSESNGPIRAVDRMVDAIRADEPPELDWDRIERSLLTRIRNGEGARPVARASSGVWQALAFAAAAAIVPLAMSAGPSRGAEHAAIEPTRDVDVAAVAAAPGEAGAHGEHDLAALRTGDAVESKDAAVTFADAGRVRWTLAPEGRLVVRSPVGGEDAIARPGAAVKTASLGPGTGHVVRLLRGSLRVEVQPDLVKDGLVDVLAVEVGQTRIAVHGTAFTVSLRDGDVVVEVEHGVVTVGPAGQRGATTGYQLPAGSRAAFSLDGAKKARWLAPTAAKTNEPIAVNAPHTAPALTVAPHVEPPPADVPSMTDPPPAHSAKPNAVAANAPATEEPKDAPPAVEPPATEPAKPMMSVASVQSGLRRCFTQAHPASSVDGPKLTASSTFTLKIRADGSLEGAQFNPPLPSIQGCAGFVWSGRFATAAAPYTLAIPVQLSQ
ncbi:MAG: FecR domain-containing protein [Polyangiaceae bacterium]